MPVLWYKDPADGVLKPYVPPQEDFVQKSGDIMTGSLKLDVPRHYGVMFIEPGGEERVVGIRTTTSGVAGLGAFKPGTDATQPLMLQPFGVGNPTQPEHAISREYLESATATAAPTLGSGWSGTVTLTIRSGWALLGFRDLKKSTAPATGDVTLTVPTLYKPAANIVEVWTAAATGNAVSGSAKTILMSLFASNGQFQLRGNAMPITNEGVYGNIGYPYV